MSTADETMQAIPHVAKQQRARVLLGMALGDKVFALATQVAAYLVLLVLAGIILSLIVGAWPAMKAFGFEFLITRRWAPQLEPEPVLGALAPIYGTLVSSFIAMLIAVPFGLGIAIFLTELCPHRLRKPVRLAIELLAGIPSIIYGMWGFFVLGPFLANYIEPSLVAAFANIPVLNSIFSGEMVSNLSLFNASLILAIMILPFITAIAVDVFSTKRPTASGVRHGKWSIMLFCPLPGSALLAV